MRGKIVLGLVLFFAAFFLSSNLYFGQIKEVVSVSLLMAETLANQETSVQGEVLADPMEALREIHRFQYNASGRRDPFMSFVKPSNEIDKKLPPLQQFDVSQMKLMGVASGGGGYGAMVQISGGKTYSVKIGTPIGTNKGHVRAIHAQEIIIEEPFLNIFGRSDLKRIVMKLYTKKEG